MILVNRMNYAHTYAAVKTDMDNLGISVRKGFFNSMSMPNKI